MCPDYELLSAYIDGEIENPWKDEIAIHLETCAACQEKVTCFQGLSRLLTEDNEPDYRTSMTRIKSKIDVMPQITGRQKISFWQKRLTLPVPLAAAAAAILICIGTFSTITIAGLKSGNTTPNPVNVVQKNQQSDDLETVIKLMENKDFNNEVILQLPTGSKFSISGEPKFIRAKDINRSK